MQPTCIVPAILNLDPAQVLSLLLTRRIVAVGGIGVVVFGFEVFSFVAEIATISILAFMCISKTKGETYSSLIRLRFPPEVALGPFPRLLGVPLVLPFVVAGVRSFLGVVAGLDVPLTRALEMLKWLTAPPAFDEARILTIRSVMARGVGFSKPSAVGRCQI